MRRSIVMGLLVLMTVGAHAQTGRPPAGVTIEEIRTVALKTDVPSPCIAVALADVTVFLDKPESKPEPDKHWRTEEERLALIEADMRRQFLAQLPSAQDETGCFSASDKNKAVHDWVFRSLERGTARVKDLKTGQFVWTIRVRYSGDRAGPMAGIGAITIYLPEAERPFFFEHWWISQLSAPARLV